MLVYQRVTYTPPVGTFEDDFLLGYFSSLEGMSSNSFVFRLSLTVEKRCSHGIHAKLFDPFPILVLAARKVSENTQKKVAEV